MALQYIKIYDSPWLDSITMDNICNGKMEGQVEHRTVFYSKQYLLTHKM